MEDDSSPLLAIADRELCARCIDGLPDLESAPPTVRSLVLGALSLAGRLAAAYLPLRLALVPLELAGSALGVPGWLSGGLAGILTGSILLVLADRLVTVQPTTLMRALLTGLARVPTLFAARFVSQLVSGRYGLLLVIPGIFRSLDYALVGPLAVLSGRGVEGAMETSTTWMRGHRGTLFLSAVVLFGAHCACLMGVAAGSSLVGLEPTDLAFRAVMLTAGPVFVLPCVLLPYVMFAKCRVARALDGEPEL